MRLQIEPHEYGLFNLLKKNDDPLWAYEQIKILRRIRRIQRIQELNNIGRRKKVVVQV